MILLDLSWLLFIGRLSETCFTLVVIPCAILGQLMRTCLLCRYLIHSWFHILEELSDGRYIADAKFEYLQMPRSSE